MLTIECLMGKIFSLFRLQNHYTFIVIIIEILQNQLYNKSVWNRAEFVLV